MIFLDILNTKDYSKWNLKVLSTISPAGIFIRYKISILRYMYFLSTIINIFTINKTYNSVTLYQ